MSNTTPALGVSLTSKLLPNAKGMDPTRPICLEVAGTDFWCFDSTISRLLCTLILKGKTYSAVDLVADARVIFDIGANVGASTVFFARTYPQATVYAFEPGRQAFDLLARNTTDCSRVKAYNFGFFDRDVEVELHIGREDSMMASVGRSAMSAASSETVRLRRIDEWMDQMLEGSIDIVKLDTEGCEMQVLKSMGERVAMTRVFHIEYHSERDRRAIDALLSPTHILAKGEILHLHRGELTYVSYETFNESPELWRDEIIVDI